MRPGSAWLLAGMLLLAGCGPRREKRPPAIGEAYVGPEALNLRQDIPLASGTAATAKRGERVEILQRRRRFVKVRTASQREGWTEQSQLLSPEVYQQIDQLARQSEGVPRLGIYRAREKLNVHLEPYRWSPSFYQLKEDDKVDLLGRQVTERTAGPPLVSGAPPAAAPPADKPKLYEEWSWVRTSEGRAGWVLARMLDADIPDEVAQYAEGRRITSYFPLSEVVDGDRVKKVWLWTTTERGLESYDFDSFRVFTWGRRRHRYETAYIERRIRGFFPVSVLPRVETRYGAGPGFSIVIEKDDGRRYTRRYVLLGHIVRRYADEPAPAPQPASASVEPLGPPQPEPPGFLRQLWLKLRRR